MDNIDWVNQYSQELEKAQAARKNGNEGMARVCARRATGIIIGEYLHRLDYAVPTSSAYDRLRMLVDLPIVSIQVKEVANHFLQRVNTDYRLPSDSDLIAESRWLAKELLGMD